MLIAGFGSAAAILMLFVLAALRRGSWPSPAGAAPQAKTLPPPVASGEPELLAGPPSGALLCGAPILNHSQAMVAYDLVLPSADLADQKLSSRELAQFARQLLDALLSLGLERLGERRVHVPIPHDILRSRYVELLPASQVVLTIAAAEAPWLLERCKELLAAGYQLSLELGRATPPPELLALCRYTRVPMADLEPAALPELVRTLREHRTRLIATGVDSRERCANAKGLLINYFRGYYFAAPEPLGTRGLSPGQRRVSQVVSLLAQRAEATEIEAAVKQDVGLSYELLRYANSAAHSLRAEVTSLRQALTLLGHERLLRWAALYLLGRKEEQSGEAHDALYATSLRRGRTLELLAQGRRPTADCELLFLIGMFSLLDLLLRVPLAQTLAEMGLPEPVRLTLVERRGPLLPYLDLAHALERFDPIGARRSMTELRIEPAELNRVQLDAMAWVEGIVQGTGPEQRSAA